MHALTAMITHWIGHQAGERRLVLTPAEWPVGPAAEGLGRHASENLRASWETVGEARRARRAT